MIAMRRAHIILLLVGAALLSAPVWAFAQPNTWTTHPTLSAGFRGWQQACYIPGTNRAVVFGGSVSTYQNDVVVIDFAASTKTQRRPQPDQPAPGHVVPYSRDGHAFFYVPAIDRCVLMGGWSGGLTPVTGTDPNLIKGQPSFAAYNEPADVWEDRKMCGSLAGSFKPGMASAVHPTTGRVLIGGGDSGWSRYWHWATFLAAPDANGCWATSTLITSNGPHAGPNMPHALVWVPPLNKFVFYRGRPSGPGSVTPPTTLESFDPTVGAQGTWATTPLGSTTGSVPFPPYREWTAMTWEPVNQVVLLLAGARYTDAVRVHDFWAWKPTLNKWTNLATLGIPNPAWTLAPNNTAPSWSQTLIAHGDGALSVVPQGVFRMAALQLSSPPPPDTTPPVIDAITIAALTDTTATITFATNEPAATAIAFGLTSSYGATTPTAPPGPGPFSVTLTGLTPNSTYHFQVTAADGAGNAAASADGVFTTPAPPPPTQAAGWVCSSLTDPIQCDFVQAPAVGVPVYDGTVTQDVIDLRRRP